jgi:HAMP domain-containing protein
MKKKKMDSLYNYITDPWTLVSFIVFVFWLWATWSNLNGRIKSLEKKTDEIDITKIEIKLAEIQKDLQRIRDELDKSRAN